MDNEVIRGQVGTVFDYLAQLNEEDRVRIIDEVLDKTIVPFNDIDFTSNDHDFLIKLDSFWEIEKEEN